MSAIGASSAKRALLLSAGLALLIGGTAAAKPFTPSSLTGMWQIDNLDSEGDQKVVLPVTPAGQAILDQRKKALASGNVLGDGNPRKCQPSGVPTMMANEFALEFLETPDRVTIVNEANPVVRSVYLDERVHTTGLEPSWNGHSIGHWEGRGAARTLVIDTVNFNDKAPPFGFIGVRSSSTHLVEHFHVAPDGKTMVGTFTFEDPRWLTRVFTQTVHYHRLPPHSELWEYVCEIGGSWDQRFEGDTAGRPAPKP